MYKSIQYLIFLSVYFSIFLFNSNIVAQNPLILEQFTADPTARVFENKVYVYPSHDIPCGEGQGFIGFYMADYHAYSSENLVDWHDHGVILSQEDVDWVDPDSYSMWAPDCVYKDGHYFFYFPAIQKEKSYRESRTIGLAISDNPYGPFMPEERPIPGILGIDPNIFMDMNGQSYIFWAGGEELFMARLKDNMKELETSPVQITGLPEGFKEGPFMFERNGIYYLTYPYVPRTTEQLVYATADNPMGPFSFRGIIMKESPIKCWTNHHSIVEYEGQWYLFYHHNDISPEFDKNRSMKADSLFFDEDSRIQEISPSLRGVGITPAGSVIQVDRYTSVSDGVDSVNFIDPQNRIQGWKITLEDVTSWLRYNAVDFGKGKFKKIMVRANPAEQGVLEVRTGSPDGTLLSRVPLDRSGGWKEFSARVKKKTRGIHDIFIILSEGENVEVDWVKFE